jgi:hypothetical protein
MSEGNSTFLNGAVPIVGESEIVQKNLALDILTITGAAGQTGDFLVLQNSAGTERLVIDKDGNIDSSNLSVTGSFGVTGSLTQSTGAVTLKGATAVSGAATFTSTIHGTGAVTLTGALTMSGGAGRLALKKNAAATPFTKLSLAMLHTLPTSAAGVATGDMFLFHVTTDIWRLAICQSGAASLFHRQRRVNFDVTLGSAS